ncbi:MAG: hypothetical protein GX556_12615 [Fibrobacter sp.]|nr:hypothetical protein [Fibrobacter sp.]
MRGQRILNPESSGRLTSSNQVRNLENRLKPFLEHRIRRAGRFNGLPQLNPENIPAESDILQLARVWNDLSPEFKVLYKEAISIPKSFSVHLSPGGNFEVYYTTVGPDSVSSADHYGFEGADWSVKTDKGNGVPDYVDEVAWALDSCWSKMIDRFGFKPPLPSKDSGHRSDRYKVIIEEQEFSYYGLTWVDDPGSREKGYPSYITLRNDWSGDEWSDLGYNEHPEDGARVTCAHELFHAVQYAMTWNVNDGIFLDDFPMTWIEGSAVLMEETVFGYIDDYLQYTDFYFRNPGMSFLNQTTENIVYTNSLLMLYLCKFAGDSPGIGFIRDVFDNNYKKLTPFHKNLRSTSASMGHLWTDLLAAFHTSSFFSGTRADTSRFLNDAGLFLQWSYDEGNYSPDAIQKAVNPYGMARFHIPPQSVRDDTLFIFLSSLSRQYYTDLGRTWAANLIIRTHEQDSVLNLHLDSLGNGTAMFPDLNEIDDIIVLVTNGHPSLVRDYIVSFQHCGINYKAGSSQSIAATSVDKQSSASVQLYTKKDLRCPLQISDTLDNRLIDSAQAHYLKPISSLFHISFPAVWSSSMSGDSISATLTMYPESSQQIDDASIYVWNSSSSLWAKSGNPIIDTSGTVNITRTITDPGIYAVFVPKTNSHKGSILASPNPVRLKGKQGQVRFTGAEILEVRIYSSTGSLVYKTVTDNLWHLNNSENKSVAPGLYHAIITFKNNETYRTETARRKIMVTP